ncbi:DUF1579 domain-containing protein [Hansschlegelia zhihuaiae]|uniref:DUF1579 domain-containing protein n=1 Tax=Hansschlegelia zhihuaiae TaxID=405005 RepID=A0A4V1KJ86_9HYPH|nr:DUF1579 domain-containing protein [Hansschlegelia zhihuaiae]RXF73322.1 DUF1579 domain-containing protein [Hansschlegelia zhihuaiae]
METPKPAKEHEWLGQLVGDWTFEGDFWMGPDQPRVKTSGRWSIRSLGGLWVVADGVGEDPTGATNTSQMTIGYEPERGRFVGSFIASMMTKFWLYDGQLDGDRLVLEAEGPAFSGQGTALYRDVFAIEGREGFRLTSEVQGEDGGWTEFLTADYRRAA